MRRVCSRSQTSTSPTSTDRRANEGEGGILAGAALFIHTTMKKIVHERSGPLVNEIWAEDPNDPFSKKVYVAHQDKGQIERIIARAQHQHENRDRSSPYWHMGDVPMVDYAQAIREGWAHDWKRWERYFDEKSRLKIGG